MRSTFTYIILLLSLLFTTASCNYREYCDDFTYSEAQRLVYEWWDSPNKTNHLSDAKKPAQVNLLLEQDTTLYNRYTTGNVSFELQPISGDYSAFAYNDAENIIIKGHTISAKTNPDGTICKVGELYTGETNFTLRSSDILEQEAENGNNHQWTSPPYHTSEGEYVFYQEAVMPMIPQTREIRIILSLGENADEYIKNIEGMLGGIIQSKNPDGTDIISGNVKLEFHIEGDELIATYRVLGCDPDEEQDLKLDITYIDGSKPDPIIIDVTNSLIDFNEELGGERVDLSFKLEVDKTELGFQVKLTDWEDVNSGDSELEVEE